jgi:YbbR domain-containing protein
MKKREYLKKLFEKDLYWKVFSVVIAAFLWFVVMNVINPTETKNFVTEV